MDPPPPCSACMHPHWSPMIHPYFVVVRTWSMVAFNVIYVFTFAVCCPAIIEPIREEASPPVCFCQKTPGYLHGPRPFLIIHALLDFIYVFVPPRIWKRSGMMDKRGGSSVRVQARRSRPRSCSPGGRLSSRGMIQTINQGVVTRHQPPSARGCPCEGPLVVVGNILAV